ncbi:MAG: hypothetical protein U0821_20505 [Chloroflexota bacterium]
MTAPTDVTALPVCAKAELELTELQREVLLQEVPAFAATLRDPSSRERYLGLAEAVASGTVPPLMIFSLEAMLELLLQTRRVRQYHGIEAEQALTELFYRTGRGAGLREAAREVNTALTALRGQTFERVTVTSGPGRHTILIETDRARLSLKIDGAGAEVDKIEVGG